MMVVEKRDICKKILQLHMHVLFIQKKKTVKKNDTNHNIMARRETRVRKY